ncbi:GNAT family N-acetyltransferase [Ostreiculturibacter nitratireducens]|uniref:GNAT family N-acetyltransferase n=1 Tax=Ostreiculturibacter nitratireducens TaxID=3075226 RepID=UPI0031B5D9CE
MQFYASTGYLNVAAQAYFPDRETDIELVKIEDHVFRLLVVDGKTAMPDLHFMDYLEPLEDVDPSAPVRKGRYARSVVREVIDASQWDREKYQDLDPAPFIDWTRFDSFSEYEEFLQTRSKRLYKDQQRRGRRLAEQFDELVFEMNDTGDDVLELAFEWKTQQFHDTGVPNYLADSRNRKYFELLRESGLLTASTLRGDGRLLSVWLGFVHDGVWSGWIFSYDKDPAFQKYSLGHQLLHAMLKESKERGHREFDFSIGDEDYKWFYCTNVRVLGPIGTPPISIRIGSGIRQVKRHAKAALERYPTLLRGATSLAETVRRKKNLIAERLQKFREGGGVQKRLNSAPGHGRPQHSTGLAGGDRDE